MSEQNTEQMSEVEQSTAPVAAEAELSYADILKGEADKPSTVEQGVEKQAQKQELSEDEKELELPGSRKVKLKDVLEWEKGYMRQQDYTKKTQSIAEFRKSLEESFGRSPELDEIKALGKLVQNYYKDPKVAKIVDQIIAGQLEQSIAQQQTQNPTKPQSNQPNSELVSLKEELENLKSQLQRREEFKIQESAKNDFDKWVEKRKAADSSFEITEELDQTLSFWIPAISQKHPDWDNQRVLDEAFRHANIDKLETSVRDKVLQSADGAKKTNPPKITSKAPQKSDNELSYKEMILGSLGS